MLSVMHPVNWFKVTSIIKFIIYKYASIQKNIWKIIAYFMYGGIIFDLLENDNNLPLRLFRL